MNILDTEGWKSEFLGMKSLEIDVDSLILTIDDVFCLHFSPSSWHLTCLHSITVDHKAKSSSLSLVSNEKRYLH